MNLLIGVIRKRFLLPRHIADGIRQDVRRERAVQQRRELNAPQMNWGAVPADVTIVTSRTETAYMVEAVCFPKKD
jgi:hypothetical protein